MSNIDKSKHFYEEIKMLLHQARTHIYSTINTTMTQKTYWQIGKRIVEEEQYGESRATYGNADWCYTLPLRRVGARQKNLRTNEWKNKVKMNSDRLN